MSGRRIFSLLAAAIILSGLIAMLPLAWLGSEALESSYREGTIHDVTANVKLFANAAQPLLAEGNQDKLKAFLDLSRQVSKTRFTIVSASGEVIAESDDKSSRMENHLNRQEIAAALAGHDGVDIRTSSTLGTEWIYVAVPLTVNNEMLAVRGAASMVELNSRLSMWWKKAASGGVVAMSLLLLLSFIAARLLAGPLETIAEGARRFAHGELSIRLPVDGSREMRELAYALNVMASELDAKFKQLTTQRGEMEAVLSSMDEGVFAVSAEGRIIFLNPAGAKMFGLDDDARGGVLEEEIRHPGVLAIIREIWDSNENISREIKLSANDGDILVLVHARKLTDDSTEEGVLIILRNVTVLRQLEKVRRDFIANVSHELRTPITAVQGGLETLIDGCKSISEDERELLVMAHRNSCRMSNIVTDLLLLSGMESGEGKTDAERVAQPVGDIITEAVTLCQPAADQHGIAIVVSCKDNIAITMNRRLMVHALVNLVDNAIKYSSENGQINVDANADAWNMIIKVKDQGIGIAARHRDRIFERFYRAHETSGNATGSGLGLSIVKHIAQVHGGNAVLEQGSGRGNTFTLTIPLR